MTCFTRLSKRAARGSSIALALVWGAAALAADPKPVIFWHTLDAGSARFLAALVAEFNGLSGGVPLKTETGMDLQQSLIERRDDKELPDVVLAPSDLVGLARDMMLSPVPPALAGAEPAVRSTVSIDGQAFGAPVFDGNHLMLLYDKKVYPAPPQDLSAIAWLRDDPYFVGVFLNAYDGLPVDAGGLACARPQFRAALSAYKALKDRAAADHCDYLCVTAQFYRRERPAVINGDWALVDAQAALGADLGVAPLPLFNGRKLRSLSATHALIFPGQALSGPHGTLLTAFARFLQSAPVQRRWLAQAQRLPVDPGVRQELARGPASIAQTSLKLLGDAVRLPTSPALTSAWPALRKGFRLFFLGVKDVSSVCAYMQGLVQRGGATP